MKIININELKEQGYEIFAYDNCHKIYLLKDNEEMESYATIEIDFLERVYETSCELRFINIYNGGDIKPLVEQFEEVEFMGGAE